MEIDERVEPLVREALGAAIKQDASRFDAALKAFPDDEARRKGLELTIAISAVALFDAYDGKPTPQDVRDAALSISELNEWCGITEAEAQGYLTTLVEGTPLEQTMEAEAAVLVTFVVTVTLLAGSPKKREGEWWFNYLDRILMQLEAAPDPTG